MYIYEQDLALNNPVGVDHYHTDNGRKLKKRYWTWMKEECQDFVTAHGVI